MGLFDKSLWAICIGTIFMFIPVGQIIYYYYKQPEKGNLLS